MIFSSAYFSMFWSPGTAIAMILHSIISLSMAKISGLWCSISLSVWIANSQSILHLLFCSTGSGWCENHLSSYLISISCTGASEVFLWFCCVSSCIGFQLGQNTNWQYGWHLQLLLCRACIEPASWWPVPFFIAFALSACSWAAHVRFSVSHFNSPAFSHFLSFSHELTLQYFLFLCCLSFFFIFPSVFVLSCNSWVAAFISISFLFAA